MRHPFIIQKSATKKTIQEMYCNDSIYLYPYARYAFLEILTKLNIKSIYMPAFICRDMLSPINNLNIKCYFYKCDENLNPILEDIACEAILVVNYFGFEQSIQTFLEYKNKYNAIIIEDNAHGFLSKDKEGQLLGTRGDIGLLSIRKTVFLPNGGALLINNNKYKDIRYDSAEISISSDDHKYNKKYLLKQKISVKYFGIIIVLLRRFIRYMKVGHAIPLPDPMTEKELPSNNKLTPMLKNKELNIDLEYETNRRIEIYINIAKWAKFFNIEPIYELYDGVVPFEFAFIDNGRYKEFERYLYTHNFFILPWPDLPNDVIDSCPEFYKKVKVVPFLW